MPSLPSRSEEAHFYVIRAFSGVLKENNHGQLAAKVSTSDEAVTTNPANTPCHTGSDCYTGSLEWMNGHAVIQLLVLIAILSPCSYKEKRKGPSFEIGIIWLCISPQILFNVVSS